MVDITHPASQTAQAAWLAAIVESSDDAIISKTLQGILTSWNPAAERLYGYCPGEVIGRPMTLLVPPDRLDEEQQILARIGRGERVERLETVAEVRRHAARAAALARSAAELNAQLDLTAVLKTVCAEAAQALEVPIAIVHLYDEGPEVFDCAESVGLPAGAAQRLRPFPRAAYEAVFRPSGKCSLTILPDVRFVPGLPNAALFAETDMRTSVAAPLRREGRTLGLLCIATIGASREFGEGELALLEALADQAALAIANAQLFQEVSAERVEIQLRHDSAGLELVIRDDGVGFDALAAQAQAVRGDSLGLLGMQERVLLLGGDLNIESTPGQGSRVWARFPLEMGAPVERRAAARHSE